MNVAERQKPAPGELFLDHVSHFVRDLDAAARVLERVGFRVSERSVQQTPQGPVGAANRCVMLEEGYIELLAPIADTPSAQRMRERIERFAGVHLACFGTPDAEGEERRLKAHGFATQPLVELAREVKGGATVRFQVARVEPEAMPEGRIQFVRQMAPEAIWTQDHLAHDNGVSGLACVYVCAADALESAARWARFTALIPARKADAIELEASRGRVAIAKPRAMEKCLGAAPPPPSLAGYALACRDPEAFLARCAQAGLNVKDDHVLLPPALGGAWKVQASKVA